MHIRPATLSDTERCQELDASYLTDCVWRMEEQANEEMASVNFQRVHMPRQMLVPYPRRLDTLREDWQRHECFLVAEDLGRVIGFLDMLAHHWRWRAQIEHLVVDRSHRGHGVGSRLLLAAKRWARGSQMQAINVMLPNKNDPAIALFRRHGYQFQGFLDDYYDNGDIGIAFTLYL
jgi:ribosomal protein S18 acetylase RimI-like enzyme